MGHNQFSDWTDEEYLTILGYIPDESSDWIDENKEREIKTFDAPYPTDYIDLVGLGRVTSVKDQGNCGACWAFSTIGALEGAYYAKNFELKSFSEQQLIDCSSNGDGLWKNKGCDGGNFFSASWYLEDNYAMLE